jgi:hypothetical protein
VARRGPFQAGGSGLPMNSRNRLQWMRCGALSALAHWAWLGTDSGWQTARHKCLQSFPK